LLESASRIRIRVFFPRFPAEKPQVRRLILDRALNERWRRLLDECD
jgi:hypothetical protein